LKGTSGDWKFSDKISVKDVKPLKTNQALKYLWARHRIAILTDYNRLEKKDKRIKEVTSLGLKYNLLTAYTSFIAVDSRVRLEDGKSVTVKQPLPLPEGVSDAALGRGRVFSKRRLLQPQAASPSFNMKESCTEKAEVKIDKGLESGNSSSGKNEESIKNRVKLGEIGITGDLKKDKVRNILEKYVPEIKKCWNEECKKRLCGQEKIVLKLIIDSGGNIEKVIIEKGMHIGKRMRECIAQKLRLAKFPQSPDDVKRIVMVNFLFE
jgi:Ca-activated chloride channel family protein